MNRRFGRSNPYDPIVNTMQLTARVFVVIARMDRSTKSPLALEEILQSRRLVSYGRKPLLKVNIITTQTKNKIKSGFFPFFKSNIQE